MRFRRVSLGRALSGVATMLLLGSCALGVDDSSPEATPLYLAAPVVSWRVTAEEAGRHVEDPVLTDPRFIFPGSEWANPAAVIDLGDLWVGAVRSRAAGGDHQIVALSPETGTMAWSYSPDTGDLLGCADQLTDGMLACAVSVGAPDPWTPTGVVLLDPDTGTVNTGFDLPLGTREWRPADSAIIAVARAGSIETMERLTLDGEAVWSTDLAEDAMEEGMAECGRWLEAGEESVTYAACGHSWIVQLADGVLLRDEPASSVSLIRNDSVLVSGGWGESDASGFEVRLVRGEDVLAELPGHELVWSLLNSDDAPVLLRSPLGDIVELDMETGATTPTGIVAGTVDSFDRVGPWLVVGAAGSLHVHDAARPGHVVWSGHSSGGDPSRTTTDGATLYSLENIRQEGADLVAVRLSDGAVLWEVPVSEFASFDPETGEPPSVAMIGDRLVLANGTGITVLGPGDPALGDATPAASNPDRVPPPAMGDGASLVAWGSDQNGEGGLPGVRAEPGIQIAAGSYHSLSIRSDGTVAAWGWNGSGQRAVPRGTQGAVAVAGGGFHSVALLADGTVRSWGSGPAADVPRGLDDVIAVSAGEEHSLALRDDGTVVAWGEDGYGQASVPADLTDIVEISAGGYHNLALRADGTVIGWGFNGSGRATPPEGLAGVTEISAGRYHNLALREDGTVVAWGKNSHGRTDVPAGLTGVTAVVAGDSHSLALRSDGTVVAWGYNGYGETDVPRGLRDVVAIAAGAYHSLALTSDGRIVAWGRDLEGQTTLPIPLTATDVSCAPDRCVALAVDGSVRQWGSSWADQFGPPPELTDAEAVAAGWNHGLALRSDGSVVGWGADYLGQASPPESMGAATAVSAGEDYSLAVTADGGVVFWGGNHMEVAVLPPGLDDVISVSAGQGHALALRSDGTVVAWGRCTSRQCDVPAELDRVVAVAAGADHSVALRSDGTVVAWGANHMGATTVPEGLGDVVAIAAGTGHTLALRSDGTVVAWGSDAEGQATVPDGLIGVIAVAAGGTHSLAVVGDR